MKRIRIMAILLLGFFVGSCEKGGNCFEKEGAIVEEERPVEQYFKFLYTRNQVDVFIRAGLPAVKARAGSNLIDLVKTLFTDSAYLVLENKNSCKWLGKFDAIAEAHVQMSELWQLTHTGVGNITILDSVTTPYFKTDLYQSAGVCNYLINNEMFVWYQHSGVTNAFISGKTKFAVIIEDDRGIVDARNLSANHVVAESNGTGDLYVYATDSLSVTITGIGDIYYKGNPVIYKNEVSGTGKLIKL